MKKLSSAPVRAATAGESSRLEPAGEKNSPVTTVIHYWPSSISPTKEFPMRTPLIRLAVGLLLLAACDKKKSAPTETTLGSIRDVPHASNAAPLLPAATPATRAG
jgi:hypothetical protein